MILLALLAGILWNLFAGLFYCWSVFIEPLEAALGVSRASVSTVFAVGVVCYSAGMFLSPHILVRVSLPRIAAGLGVDLEDFMAPRPAAQHGAGARGAEGQP